MFGGEEQPQASASQGDAKDMIKAAEEATQKAASADGEWRDTANLIKEAKGALAKGDSNKAEKLAKEAMDQGNLGYEQAVAEKNAGPWLF